MFKRILIANRGEIAMRVIRACRELGIRTVVIYAECDATAIYVKKADEAHLIGPDPVQGFLDMQAIVDLAKRSGADGIHPGYGFLSENADFAKLCEDSGITFIGPSPEAIRMMGNKVQAREIARKVGVPIVPGTEKSVTNPTQALSFAARTGYPLMVKATMGGGGRGLHVVRNDQELLSQMEVARREALSSFGNGEIFLEKYIERPHQKLIEIAPSLVLDKELRARMGEAAIAVAKAVNYDNAGTVEFILDPNRNFYFIEMNTRIQVEHTVTEQITAIDLVRSQIEIAAGLPLEFRQEDVTLQGYAIQCRINAEDPLNNFRPCTGTVTAYFSPGGIGVRIDGMAYKDYTIPPYYDALLAKLVVRGRTWEETVSRAHRSLEEFVLRGVKTTIPFMKRIMEDPDFQAGRFDTSFLKLHPKLFTYEDYTDPEDLVIAVSTAIAAYEGL